VASATYKEWAAYRTHSMISIFTGPLYFLVQTCIWSAVYKTGASVGGMSLDDMLTYYAVTTLIAYLTMDFADWNLQMLIRTGRFITYALRPMHHRFFAFSQKLGHRTLGFIFEFLPVLAVFLLVFRIGLRPASWPFTLLSVALSFMMVFLVNYCIGLAGFWLTRTEGVRSVIQLLISLCSGALFPLIILPRALQALVFFLPFQFMTYVPGMVYTGQYRLGAFAMAVPQIVCLQAAYVLLFLCLSEFIYRLGLKRFTAVGA